MNLALEVKNLSKRYKNKVDALKNLNIKVEKGDFLALLGKNGAGKSTFIGIIASLIKKDYGKVSIFNKNIDDIPDAVKTHIGIVPQEFNFPIFEKVIQILVSQAGYHGWGRKIAYQRAEKYLSMLNLTEKKNETAINLSGGMKRRLMIARALMHEPSVIFLDEPTAGVDIEVRLKIWNFLSYLNKLGRTIILTTHYFEEAERLCNSLAIIHRGKIIIHNSISNIKKQYKNSIIIDIKCDKKTIKLLAEQRKISVIYDNKIKIQLDNNINELLLFLIENNVKITNIRNCKNQLEELFINLTK